MFYNVNKVGERVAKSYFKFCREYGLEGYDDLELYELLSFAVSQLFGVESCEFNWLVSKYGSTCIEFLKKTRRIPKKWFKLALSSRLAICSYCKSYYVAVCKILDSEETEIIEYPISL